MLGINDVVRVVAEWDAPAGTIAQLVYHYILTAGANEDPNDVLDDIVIGLQAAWANIDSFIDDEYTGADIELYQYDFTNHRWDGVASKPMVSLDGTLTAECMGHGQAVLGKIWTESARRQSRKYIPGFTENHNDDGYLSATALTWVAVFMSALDNNITSGTATLVYCTFNTDPLSALYETASKAIQTAGGEALYAYQRRRRPGTGI